MENVNKAIRRLLFEIENFDASKYDELFLNKTLKNRIIGVHCKSEHEYFEYLKQNLAEAKEFISSLSVNYTDFFRNSLTFSILEKIVLPKIIFSKVKQKQHEIRIWSAACAAGQEAYSLAILLKELTSDLDVNFRIFATDQSDEQIAIASKGEYSFDELQHLTVSRLNNWFEKTKEVYRIKHELKNYIEFSTFDLLSPEFSSPPGSIFGDFDLIMCANLLFYYKPEYQKVMLEKLKMSLSEKGYLVTGETEREILTRNCFIETFPNAAIFKK